MATTVQTKFDHLEKAYILSEAQKGIITGGPIQGIVIKIGDGAPVILYKIENNDVFVPPGGYWQEAELCTLTEAKTASSSYHTLQSDYHSVRAAQHAP